MGDQRHSGLKLDRRRLRSHREQLGLSQAELAEQAQITKSYISMLERGERSTVSAKVAVRLANALDVAIADLMQRTPRLRKP